MNWPMYREFEYDGTVTMRFEGEALVRKVRGLIGDLDCASVVTMSSGTSLELMLCEVSPHFWPLTKALEGALGDTSLMQGCKAVLERGIREATMAPVPPGAWPV